MYASTPRGACAPNGRAHVRVQRRGRSQAATRLWPRL